VALLPIKNKICFFTSLQNFIKIVQTIIKRSSIDGEIKISFFSLALMAGDDQEEVALGQEEGHRKGPPRPKAH
jgi:hypothetical protein